jgi:hypothetical protein
MDKIGKGTTSVVPPDAKKNAGFSPCGTLVHRTLLSDPFDFVAAHEPAFPHLLSPPPKA